MKKVLTLTLMLLVFVPSVLRAQTNTEPISCFDYYKFGSVYASLETKNYANVSGTKINFFGEIKNDNAYPIVDGKLFVKIMRSNDSYDKTGGQDEVDSFVVKEGISIPANSSIPTSFDWTIPGYAIGGDYQASTYFLVDDSFNMSGLSFTTDIVGGVVKFSVIGEQKSDVYFDRTKITLNDNPYYTVAFTPSVPATSTANISLTLTNDTDKMQEVPVTLSLYSWDSQAKKNLIKTEDTSYLLNAKSSKKISYEVKDTDHSVYFLIAKAGYKDSKSEVSVRFGRQGKQEPRINFSTFATYPFEKGKQNSLITCVHNTNNNDAEYGKVVTTIYDHKGTPIHTSTYEGKITGAIQGLKSNFTPTSAYKDLTIATKIYDKDGNIMDETSVEYKCSDLLDDCKEPLLIFNLKTLIAIISLIILIGIILLIGKHMKKRNLVTPLVLMFILGAMLMPQVGEAKSVSFEGTRPLNYCEAPVNGMIGGNLAYDLELSAGGDLSHCVSGYAFSVRYHGNVKNLTTGQVLNINDTVNPGDILRFIFGKSDTDFLFDYKDIYWFLYGYSVDSPYGEWVNNAGYFHEWNNYKYYFTESDNYQWGAYSVNPPSKQLLNQSSLTCSTMQPNDYYIDCTVAPASANTVINPTFKYGETYAAMYELASADANVPTGVIWDVIGSVEVAFPLTVQPSATCVSNATPTAPTISVNPASPIVGQDATITLSSTDAENDAISYQVDWGNGQWISMPSSFPKTWTETGEKTFKVRAMDNCHQSGETSKTVTVQNPPQPQTPTLTVSKGTCHTANATWTMNAGEIYNLYDGDGNLVQSNAQSPQSISGLTEDTSYTYKLVAKIGNEIKESNSVSVSTGYCPPACVNSQKNGCSPGSAINQVTLPNAYQWKCSYHGQETDVCTFSRSGEITDPSLEFTIYPKLAPNCEASINVKDVKSCDIKKGSDKIGNTYPANGADKINESNISIPTAGMYNLECIDLNNQIKNSNYQSCVSDFNTIQR